MPTRAPALPGLLLALTLTALAGLTGCGGDSDASADPPAPAPTSASTTPTVDPTPTTPPTQAPPGETARQFVYRWNQLDKYMQNTGDTAAYRAITKPCDACQETASKVETYYAAGGEVRTQGREILSLRQIPSQDGYIVFRARLRLGTTTYRTSASAAAEHLDGGARVYQIELRKARPWVLSNYYVVVS